MPAALVLLLATSVQAPVARWTPELAFSVRRVGSVAMSPDGRWAAVEVSEPLMEPEPSEWRTSVYQYAVGATGQQAARRVETPASAPAWSPDGVRAHGRGRAGARRARDRGGAAVRAPLPGRRGGGRDREGDGRPAAHPAGRPGGRACGCGNEWSSVRLGAGRRRDCLLALALAGGGRLGAGRRVGSGRRDGQNAVARGDAGGRGRTCLVARRSLGGGHGLGRAGHVRAHVPGRARLARERRGSPAGGELRPATGDRRVDG